jgi:hypothetical protein
MPVAPGRPPEADSVTMSDQAGSGRPSPLSGTPIHVLGVDYLHSVTEEGGDLYLTAAGQAHAEHLLPQNWHEKQWFRTHREVLRGTGAVYAVPTRPVDGESLGLVVKFCRVGERVPIETGLIEDLLDYEFNGPFEEFALVEDLRRGRRGRAAGNEAVRTQLPLAIYVPPDRMQASQTGRFQWRIDRAVARHPGVAIDILREYIMVYEWIQGVDAAEAQDMGLMTRDEVSDLDACATAELRSRGYRMLDMKPAHLIVQLQSATSLVARNGQVDHAVIDYELLERTPEYERQVKEARRAAFLRRLQRMEEPDHAPAPLPPNLHAMRIWEVDYVQGRVESTGGILWVVGREPESFDLFLPERWRTTPQYPLPPSPETYSTVTKDNIPLVWTVSSVGERPQIAAHGPAGFRLLTHGYNAPFEEVAFARWLLRRGIATTLPIAIYATGYHSLPNEAPFDTSRYRKHEHWRTFDGTLILEAQRNYITLWEQWHGPEPDDVGGSTLAPLDAKEATEQGWMTVGESADLVQSFEERLRRVGVEALRLVPEHLLVTRRADGTLRRDEDGHMAARLCHFEFLRWVGPGPLGQ